MRWFFSIKNKTGTASKEELARLATGLAAAGGLVRTEPIVRIYIYICIYKVMTTQTTQQKTNLQSFPFFFFLFLSLFSLSLSHTHARTHPRTHTHARARTHRAHIRSTHTRARARARALSLSLFLPFFLLLLSFPPFSLRRCLTTRTCLRC